MFLPSFVLGGVTAGVRGEEGSVDGVVNYRTGVAVRPHCTGFLPINNVANLLLRNTTSSLSLTPSGLQVSLNEVKD